MKKIIIVLLFMFLLFLSLLLLAQEYKLRVIAEKASIYLNPEKNSPVIETVEKGTILILLSKEKIRDFWYYVSFHSKEKFITVTGFVYASKVQEMFEVPKATRKERRQPTEIGEEVMLEPPQKIQVILEKANIREEPSFKSEIIHQVQFGITLLAVGRIKEWYRVDLPPDEDGIIISGYIHQSLVQEISKKVG